MPALVETIAYAYKKDSKDAAYQVPWHSLGEQKDPNATPREFQKSAGLDWTVERCPQFITWHGKKVPTGKDALVRSTDGRILTHVTPEWIYPQNSDFFDFCEDFAKKGNIEMNTAGSLRDGNLVWILVKLKRSFALRFGKKRDEVENYLLMTLPHEYGKCIDIRGTNIRVVCANTMALALAGKSDMQVKLNHRKAFDPEEVKDILGISDKKFEAYKEMAEFLAAKKFKKALLGAYFDVVFPSTAKPDEDGEVKLSRPAQTCLDSIDEQPGHELGEGTWWQAYNAVTFNIDHVLGHSDDTRLQSAWYGDNRKRKLVALEKAIEFANA